MQQQRKARAAKHALCFSTSACAGHWLNMRLG